MINDSAPLRRGRIFIITLLALFTAGAAVNMRAATAVHMQAEYLDPLGTLTAGERLATELMQDDLNGERLANELLSLLEPRRNVEMRERLSEVAYELGEGGASDHAAERVLAALQEWQQGGARQNQER